MSKVHGTTTLTFSDGSERHLSNQRIYEVAADPTSDAAAPIVALFRECVSARSTNGHLHELILCYINGPAKTKEETVN
jgi:hypothetical protein